MTHTLLFEPRKRRQKPAWSFKHHNNWPRCSNPSLSVFGLCCAKSFLQHKRKRDDRGNRNRSRTLNQTSERVKGGSASRVWESSHFESAIDLESSPSEPPNDGSADAGYLLVNAELQRRRRSGRCGGESGNLRNGVYIPAFLLCARCSDQFFL